MNNTSEKKITTIFNILLFCFILLTAFSNTFVTEDKSVPFDAFFGRYPIAAWTMAILLIAFLLLVGAKFIQEFWNRLISNVFSLRHVAYQEALSISLIIGLLSL